MKPVKGYKMSTDKYYVIDEKELHTIQLKIDATREMIQEVNEDIKNFYNKHQNILKDPSVNAILYFSNNFLTKDS